MELLQGNFSKISLCEINASLFKIVLVLQTKSSFPRPPLRPTNPKVNKRIGTTVVNKDATKPKIPIPTNPVTQRPKGSKPPIIYYDKENIGIPIILQNLKEVHLILLNWKSLTSRRENIYRKLSTIMLSACIILVFTQKFK